MPSENHRLKWIYKMDSQIIHVNNDGKAAYDIILSRDFAAFDYGNKDKRLCIVTDSNVAKYCLNDTVASLSRHFKDIITFTFDAGEENKNLETVQDLYAFLIENHFDRKCVLGALGGGVVGDLTGFAAATYLRGIPFIQIPTSLLACVDSSVGGKTGVDFRRYKNMVGAFNMPELVYMNTSLMATLPDREVSCGMAEVIKYGYIMDRDFLDIISQNSGALLAKDPEALGAIVKRCCECKKEVVEEDPYEKGRRAILNFGHTAGHAVEKAAGFKLNHGECVAIGMNAALYISENRGYISSSDREKALELMICFNLPVTVPKEIKSAPELSSALTNQALIDNMRSDKKTLDGNIRFVLLKETGEAFVCGDVSEDEINKALEVVLS